MGSVFLSPPMPCPSHPWPATWPLEQNNYVNPLPINTNSLDHTQKVRFIIIIGQDIIMANVKSSYKSIQFGGLPAQEYGAEDNSSKNSSSSTKSTPTYRQQYRTYTWRWFMLTSLVLLNISNGMVCSLDLKQWVLSYNHYKAFTLTVCSVHNFCTKSYSPCSSGV